MVSVETESFAYDGTQPSPPPRLHPDPLAGLVTGESVAGTDLISSHRDEFEVPIAKPVEADKQAVQAMVEAALSENPGAEDGSDAGTQRSGQVGTGTGGEPFLSGQGRQRTAQPRSAVPGMVPPPHHNRPTGQQAWQALRSYPRQYRAQNAQQESEQGTLGVWSKNSGVIVAIALLVVFALIAIQLIASVLEGISTLFG